MTKLDIQKLAATLSGKERAKLVITSWHEAIVGKTTFSEAEQSALLRFDGTQQPGEARNCNYYLSLYKHGYFIYRDSILEAYLRVVVLSTLLQQFHTAIGVDGAIKMSLGAIQGVPKFVAESEFKQIRNKRHQCF